MNLSRESGFSKKWPVDAVLVAILMVGGSLRLQYVTAPFAAAHSWRQLMNADIARNFFEGSLNVFYPEVSWGGTDRYVGIEMPLFQALVAAIYRVAGEHEIVGRLVSIAFSLATITLIYWLGRTLFGRGPGRAAAFFFAVAPSSVFFGRTFLSDVPMLCYSVAAVLAWRWYCCTQQRIWSLVGTAAATLACVSKLPAVIILPSIAYMGWRAARWRVLRDRWVLGGAAVVVAATAGWYWHAELIHRTTGLGVAIFSPSGTYRQLIARRAHPWHQMSIWTSSLSDLQPVTVLLRRLWWLHLTPLGVLGCLIGLWRAWKSDEGRLVLIWLAGALLLIGATIPGQADNEYYQLPLLPPAALLFGLGLGRPFEIQGTSLRSRCVGLLAVAAIIAGAHVCFGWSRVVSDYFRPNHLDYNTIAAGASIDQRVEPQALLITIHFDREGVNSPILLYRAHRRGWSFDHEAVSEPLVKYLQMQGAWYAAVVDWRALAQERPLVAKYLMAHRSVPVTSLKDNIVLFDLRVQVLPLSARRNVVEAVASAQPGLLAAPCESHGTPGVFLVAVLNALRQDDRRWGLNWKRGVVGDVSQNALAYHWGDDPPEGSTDVHVVQIISDACGPQAKPVWVDLTVNTALYGVVGRWTLAQ